MGRQATHHAGCLCDWEFERRTDSPTILHSTLRVLRSRPNRRPNRPPPPAPRTAHIVVPASPEHRSNVAWRSGPRVARDLLCPRSTRPQGKARHVANVSGDLGAVERGMHPLLARPRGEVDVGGAAAVGRKIGLNALTTYVHIGLGGAFRGCVTPAAGETGRRARDDSGCKNATRTRDIPWRNTSGLGGKVAKRGAAVRVTMARARIKLDRRPVAHFLHVGKTAGMAVKVALREATGLANYRVVGQLHDFRLADIPETEYYFFCIRDPVDRYVSGFLYRELQGRPRFFHPWSEAEAKAFAQFPSPDALAVSLSAEALSNGTPKQRCDRYGTYSPPTGIGSGIPTTS